jgi:hypothetical protein
MGDADYEIYDDGELSADTFEEIPQTEKGWENIPHATAITPNGYQGMPITEEARNHQTITLVDGRDDHAFYNERRARLLESLNTPETIKTDFRFYSSDDEREAMILQARIAGYNQIIVSYKP